MPGVHEAVSAGSGLVVASGASS